MASKAKFLVGFYDKSEVFGGASVIHVIKPRSKQECNGFRAIGL